MTHNHRDDQLNEQLISILRRRTPPQRISDNQTALRKETASLFRALKKSAPPHISPEWLIKFEDELFKTPRTRSWPIPSEIVDAVSAANKKESKRVSCPKVWVLDECQITANRINDDKETVSENHLFGRAAVKILQLGLVSLEQMTARQDAHLATLPPNMQEVLRDKHAQSEREAELQLCT